MTSSPPETVARMTPAETHSVGMRSIPTHLGRLAVYDTGIPGRTDASTQVLDALEIRQPVVCMGTSWGGLVAGEFALRHSDRTRAVVMLNTPVFKSSARWRDSFVSWGARWLKFTNVYVQGVAEAYFMPRRAGARPSSWMNSASTSGAPAVRRWPGRFARCCWSETSWLRVCRASPRRRCSSPERTTPCTQSTTCAAPPLNCRAAASSRCRRLTSPWSMRRRNHARHRILPGRVVKNESRVILVTGGTRGIGAAIAAQLHGCGHRVYVTQRAQLMGGRQDGLQVLSLDITSAASSRPVCTNCCDARAASMCW